MDTYVHKQSFLSFSSFWANKRKGEEIKTFFLTSNSNEDDILLLFLHKGT